ncbi:MAG: fumarylacetoacetate hydrolase family protein [Rhizobiaceae bacterium]|nr:fumarylacetoacetate hydrolase family protein [Rhizobiaceae bacterium]
MTEYAFEPCPPATVAVAGSDKRFPVRRIFCVGRNYAAHAREMGKDPNREPPFFFTKPADAVINSDQTIPYPSLTDNLHHEVELVVAIGTGGSNIPVSAAKAHIWGYGVGIDLTRRDVQEEAKRLSRPWDWSKAFDNSAPCGPLVQAAEIGHPTHGRIWLGVNGQLRQQGNLSEMIWSVPDIVSLCSESVELKPGDLIYTGTPSGVGRLAPGDSVRAGIENLGEIAITIGARGAHKTL